MGLFVSKSCRISLLASLFGLSLISCGEKKVSFPMPTGPETSSVLVKAVPGISDDFIRGMDASSVLAEEKSGVVYYNFAGEEQDVFKTLAESGINYIRLRVWNDPFDANGNGYGGGNNDVPTAIELGKRATQYGMKVCIDFHYSDFWADPKRQNSPKAWAGMNIDDKAAALEAFTKESLSKILDAGVDVGMVQIGNEINFGLAGEKKIINIMKLLNSGSKAVREVSKKHRKDIKIAVHYTEIRDSEGIDRIAAVLENFKVDYDVFGISYYSFWHGTFENLKKVIANLREKYSKTVMVVETSYCYTDQDGDGFGNSISGRGDIVDGYPATVQGQTTMIRDVIAAANEAGAKGVFYWEGTWIPVGKAGADNSPVWEKFGSGWASSYAAEYDPEDAGLYYGGCSWDNQAFFDFTGHPLASLNVFKYLKYGSTAPLAVDNVPDVYVDCDVGTSLKLPEQVAVIYNDHDKNTFVPVKWDSDVVSKIDTSYEGSYEIPGAVDGGSVVAHVRVLLLNHAKNPSFEDEDTSMWNISFAGKNNPCDFQKKKDDAHSGNVSLHFWSENDMDLTLEQELSGLEPGTYRLSAFAQGGDVKKGSSFELFMITDDGKELTAPFMLTGWVDWKNPTINAIKIRGGKIKFGIRAKCNSRGWGTFDDFTLNRMGD